MTTAALGKVEIDLFLIRILRIRKLKMNMLLKFQSEANCATLYEAEASPGMESWEWIVGWWR